MKYTISFQFYDIYSEKEKADDPAKEDTGLFFFRGKPGENHKYPRLSHGFGLGVGTVAEGWIEDAVVFWEKHMKEWVESLLLE